MNYTTRFVFIVFILSMALLGRCDAETDGPRLKSPCSMNFALLGDKVASAPLRGIVFDQPPPQVSGLLKISHPSSSAIISQVPKTEKSYTAIFPGKAVSKTARHDMEVAQAALVEAKLEETAVNNVVKFIEELKNNSSHNIILIGHNDRGNFFFADGSSSYLWNLSQNCAEQKKTCIFISCRSDKYVTGEAIGVGHDLTFREGIDIALKIESWLKLQTNGVSDSQLAAFVSNVQANAYLRYHVSYIALNGCGAVAGGVVVYLFVEQK